MKILKTAVVGLGRIGWSHHIPQILGRKDQYNLVAVVDVSVERLAEAKEKYGLNGYTDIAEMIGAEKPDLVVVASPTHLHEAHACTAMEMGCDVFLDKPMSNDYESSCRIVQCAENTGRKLMIYHATREIQDCNQIKALIETGKIGELVRIQRSRLGYSRRNDWQSFRKFGGGMLNNYGHHHMDEMLYITGEKISRLSCYIKTVACAGDAEDVVNIQLISESGVILNVDINQAAALPTPAWAVYGKYGAIVSEVSEDNGMQFRMRWYDPSELPTAVASEDLAAAGRSYNNDVSIPWKEEVYRLDNSYEIPFYQKVYEYCALGQEPFVPIRQSLYLMELIDRCYKDAEK